MVVTTLTAFFKADFVTSTGSIIPAFIILTGLPVTTSIPHPLRSNCNASSKPAFFNIVLYGALIASNKTSSPLVFGLIF